MRHHVKKIKLKKGVDAKHGAVRKLISNFVRYGSIETTLSKAKILKSLIDRLVVKATEKSEAAKNVIMWYIAEKELVAKMFDVVGTSAGEKKGGFVSLSRTRIRVGDGAVLAKLTWTIPVVEEKKKTEKKEVLEKGKASEKKDQKKG
ncbi:MAG TPA: L17 family ribosomal protein [Patescibacteria group bacterium]|nr:L17 family ribosomal protein [Patescibacteria group bacterium]